MSSDTVPNHAVGADTGTNTHRSEAFDDTVVLLPAPDLVEVPVADEVILWKRDRAVPLQLSSVATTIWWHLETAPLADVARDVAAFYRQPIDRVTPGVHFVARSLHHAGLLRTHAEQLAVEPKPPPAAPAVIEHERCAQISSAADSWLQRRVVHRVSTQVGRVRFGIASNTADLHERVSSRLVSHLDSAPTAAIRYHLIDAGDGGPGFRYWLISDTGLPLERTDSPDDLIERCCLHVAELAAVQRTTGIPLRLAVLEADDHAVAVQWDLLASRPVLEPALDRLGYRIRSGQWAVVDRSDHSVRPSATLGAADDPDASGLPLRSIVAWCAPGSLDAPSTRAEWAWTLAVFGCASPDPGDLDRTALLEAAVILTDTVTLKPLSDAGPSSLLDALADISRS